VITAEQLEELLQRKVLKGTMKLPGQAELAELARALEWWRGADANEASLAAIREGQSKVRKAAEKLETALDDLRRAYGERAGGGDLPDGVYRTLMRRGTDAARARDLVGRAILSDPFLGQGYIDGRWQSIGLALVDDFVSAMQPSNPGYNGGISKDGPAARFVYEVVPLITGEHPKSVASVATQLKRMRKNNR